MKDIVIPYDQAKDLLRITDQRTLDTFIKQAKITVVFSNEDPLVKALRPGDIGRALRIKTLPKKFLVADEVAQMLNINPTQIISLCNNNLLPHYKLNPNRGSRKLFVQEEVLASETAKIILERSLEAWAVDWRLKKYQEVINELLLIAKRNGFFSAKSYDIVDSLLNQKTNLKQLGRKYHQTSEGIHYVFDRKLETLLDGVGCLANSMQALKQENKRLKKENWELKTMLGDKAVVANEVKPIESGLFGIKLTDLDLPNRALNCFAGRIENLGQLAGYTKSQLLKLSSFGKKTMAEVAEVILDQGVILED